MLCEWAWPGWGLGWNGWWWPPVVPRPWDGGDGAGVGRLRRGAGAGAGAARMGCAAASRLAGWLGVAA